MGYGTKVSRAGYDVNVASDKQLAFSSEWPILPIEAEGSLEMTNTTSYDQTLYTHSFGYVPIFFLWEEYDSKLYSANHIVNYNVFATTTTLEIDDTAIVDLTLHWKVFRKPLLTAYDAGNLISTDATERDTGDFGILTSLPGNSVFSTDNRDFSFRSDERQLMVHMCGETGEIADSGSESISHDLGYKPIYWVYMETVDINGADTWGLITQGNTFAIDVDNSDITFYNYIGSAETFAYVIFKDPINADG